MSGQGAVPVAALLMTGLCALVCATLLSACEVAISKLSHAAVDDLVEEGRRGARRLSALVEHRVRTTLVLRGVRTFTQVIFAVASTVLALYVPLTWWAAALLATVGVSVLQFLCVSVVASAWGTRQPERVALRGVLVVERMVACAAVMDPLVEALRSRLPQSERTEAEMRAEMADELREMVDQVGETEGLEAEDRQMLRSVFELGHTLVREVMVPRTDMVTIAADVPARKALRLFVRSGYSRIPVTGEDTDDVRGILYFKDVVQRLEMRGLDDELVAEQMMRPAEFTVEMKAADDLLRDMQSGQYHMACVVDEYGGISGVVTLEDLVEEIVGDLTDEHDRHVMTPEDLGEGTWRVPSRLGIGELGELLGIELEDDDVDSVGGLLAKALGRVPLPGASAEVSGVHMIAEEARGRRRQVATVLCRRVDEIPAHDVESEED